MTNPVDPRLYRLLGGDALANLRKRLRRHFERTRVIDVQPDDFHLDRLAPEEREALASLMGHPPSHASSMRVKVTVIDASLHAAMIARSLRHALELLDGPIVNQADTRADLCERWSAIVDGSRHQNLATFLQTSEGMGLLKRLARQDMKRATLLRNWADAVFERLPACGLTLAQLAAETTGNAHGLDANQPLATLVLSAWRHSEPSLVAMDNAEQRKAERTRHIWARAGILVNELAKPALLLNLPSEGGDSLVKSGEPTYVSLRLLLRSQPNWAVSGLNVFVCENPNLLAIAADNLGSRCAPLVCTDGMPAAAQRTLLTQLAEAGAHLLYHGDFDWPGIHIANHVIKTHGAKPWRFSDVDYLAAASTASRLEHKLKGNPVVASWDAKLTLAMQFHGLAIPEESLATSLLQDLSNGASGR
ncbi:MAG: TIGR02679 family protein [Rhodospirillales bacterium]|nr:TIGR02679 family protein [Rhodospirillales bacterium]